MGDTAIRNFCWVEPGKLARGEQPPLHTGAYATLREMGITCVFSLREQGEQACVVVGRPYPAYSVEEEEAFCRAAGLSFYHSPCPDGQSPAPAELAAALERIEQEAERGGAVYLHCAAGIGRTGIVSAAWLMRRGASGDEAAAHFLTFMLDMMARTEALSGEKQDGFLRSQILCEQWWALVSIAEAYGTPLRADREEPIALRPAYAEGWDQDYPRLLTGACG